MSKTCMCGVDLFSCFSDNEYSLGDHMNITLTLNQKVIQQFCKQENVSEESVTNDLLYYFHLIQDDKEFFKKEVLDRVFQS
jgi:hypothetical protein